MALYEWGLTTSRQSLLRVNAIQRLNNFAIGQLFGGRFIRVITKPGKKPTEQTYRRDSQQNALCQSLK